MPLYKSIPIECIEGFHIGQVTHDDTGTGTTVIVAPEGATGGVDVRGGAPASRETDLLRPEQTVDVVHAVALSGGSAFGLEAASGVMRELAKREIGLDVGVAKVPIVCSSCIFDLAYKAANAFPTVEDGIQATINAFESVGKPVATGNVGAGTGATVGKLMGPKHTMKGGLGTAAMQVGALQVGAVVAVNACGNVYNPTTNKPIAGMCVAKGTPILSIEEAALNAIAGANKLGLKMPLERTNTTIACIITNAPLTKAQATKVAQMAADAYAHTIRPTHTTNDGDTIYVLSRKDPHGDRDSLRSIPLDAIGIAATKTLEQAIVCGVKDAQ